MKLMKDLQANNVFTILEDIWRRFEGQTRAFSLGDARATDCTISQ